MDKRALVTGITGQDGAYLARLLLDKGYEIYGAYRRLSSPNFWRLQYLSIFDQVNLIPIDLTDTSSIMEAIQVANPDEIYNLAAQSFVEASFEQPIATANVSGVSVTRFLEVIRQTKPDARFYQASTSEMFGSVGNSTRPLTIGDQLKPLSPYAAAKLYAHWITRIYAEAYNIFACSGLLFNHESPLRGLEFVTRKISNAVAKIKLGLEKEIVLGNLDAKRDWGYAPEYVEAMWLMLQQEKPGDYVAATGEAHSVKEFAERAFDVVGLDWQNYVKIDKRFLRPLDITCLIGDSSKARTELGWSPKTNLNGLVEIMVQEDLKRWEKWVAGERFPWDAPNYPTEARILTRAQRM
jgi:GDPmannose 4,6-dehydratase